MAWLWRRNELGVVMDLLVLRGMGVVWMRRIRETALPHSRKTLPLLPWIAQVHIRDSKGPVYSDLTKNDLQVCTHRPVPRAYCAADFPIIKRAIAAAHSPHCKVKMPAIPVHDSLFELEKREWRNTVGRSGMTSTAFAFLIPIFVVVVFCPL